MHKLIALCILSLVLSPSLARATLFGQIHGVVHDPQHRPIAGAHIQLHAVHSGFAKTDITNAEGSFTFPSIPLGEFNVRVTQTGFATLTQPLTLASGTSPVLHFILQLDTVQQTVAVQQAAPSANVDTVTPTVLLSRQEIAQTPGADRTNSLAMITDFVPGAYITHDMLHLRGGHQVSWLIDGVAIPNTNIASNLGAQIDPKDIDYLEVERGSYTADVGDRTYGVFNIVPRSGFERNSEAELVLSAGSFLQTNDQFNLGDHSQHFAYYLSLSGNRTDYGLSPPSTQLRHDAGNGYGTFASLLYNRTPKDQLRLVAQLRGDHFQIPYDPDPSSFSNAQFNSVGLRDTQHETDGLVALSWLHTFNPSTVLQISPFYHGNRADYQPGANDTPVATTSDRTSHYGGAQASVTAEIHRLSVQAGLYAYGQHDSYRFGAVFHDGSGTPSFSIPDRVAGGVVEAYVSANEKVTSWLTLIAGLRQTHFQGQFTEGATAPRFGVAVRMPRLNWVFRGFYGQFYQPPPLLTATGPIVQYAEASNTAFQPLHGESDEEHQFGVQIPLRGWLLDADTFRTHIRNLLDHANIGNSSIYYPVTVDGGLVRAWELTVRSPHLWRFGQAHLAYSNQIAQQRGNITGGLICTPVGDPACDSGFTYTPLDHDQRNTLNLGLNATLPLRAFVSANLYYGSGFHNGDPDPATPYPHDYLPHNSSLDLSLGKSFGKRTSASITATNLVNRRVLVDNSLTFGGFHYSDPRQIFAELRYHFPF